MTDHPAHADPAAPSPPPSGAAFFERPEPRVVASGRWEQDEFGDVTYIPAHLRPCLGDEDGQDDDPAPAHPSGAYAGYRIRSDETWEAARRDFLAGDTARSVCDRYDLSLSTFKHRAAQGGWRRSDAPDPAPVDLQAERAAGLPDLGDMAANALVRANRAILSGRAAEAASWIRIHRYLSAAAPAAAPAAPPPAPNPLDDLERDLKEMIAIAEAAYDLDEDDVEGQAAVQARLDALQARPAPGGISDLSDLSDPVFSAPESESGAAAAAPP